MSKTVSSEIPEEAKLNRGYVTVYERVKDGNNIDEGDRFIRLGYCTKQQRLTNEGTAKQDFEVVAVPIAHIELPEPLNSEDDFEDWAQSDVAKLALSHYVDDVEKPDVLTPHGLSRVGVGESDG
jgi:hypothetical protein